VEENYVEKSAGSLRAIAEAHEREEMEKKAREEAERKLPVIASMYGHPPEALPFSRSGPGDVTLSGTSLTVQRDGTALVRLDCAGSDSCKGKLTLLAKATSRTKGGKKVSRTIAIGTAKFSIAAGKTATVKVKLDTAGRRLMSAAHERLAARLTILELASAPGHTQTANVRLNGRRSRGKAKN
jgi:hypothetical protein